MDTMEQIRIALATLCISWQIKGPNIVRVKNYQFNKKYLVMDLGLWISGPSTRLRVTIMWDLPVR